MPNHQFLLFGFQKSIIKGDKHEIWILNKLNMNTEFYFKNFNSQHGYFRSLQVVATAEAVVASLMVNNFMPISLTLFKYV